MAIRRFSGSNLSGSKSSKLWDQTTTPGYFESIATITVDSNASSSVTFSNIPQNYAHLQLRATWGFTDTGNNTWLNVQFNGDSGTNYAYHALRGDGGNTIITAGATKTKISFGADAAGNANAWGASVTDILDYTSTTKNKTTRSLSGQDLNGSGGVGLWSGLWFPSSPAAITSLTITTDTSTFRANSIFALYGIRGA